MPDPILIVTIVSGAAFAFAAGKSLWHGRKLDRLLHQATPPRDGER